MSQGRTKDEVYRLTLAWAAEILRDSEISLSDNFIEFGGHSILALRMCVNAKERFGAEYDLMLLFEQDLAAAADDLANRIPGGVSRNA